MSGPLRSRTWGAVVLVTTTVLVTATPALTACSTTRIPVRTTITPSDEPTPTPATTVTGSPTATPTVGPSTGQQTAAAALVAKVGLTTADLPAGSALAIKLAPGGDQVAGQITLDNCGHQFVTEKRRVARRQVTLVDARGRQSGLSGEVVVYDSARHAAEALQEWRTSVDACQAGTLIQPQVAGAPRLRYDSVSTAADESLPVAENTVTTAALTLAATRARRYRVTVLQQYGSALDVVSLQTSSQPLRSQINQLMVLATATGKRLSTTNS
jgi:hypothetical protein